MPGIFTVAMSRTNHPKHNYIPDDQWPTAADIQIQRTNPFVIEAEIFERALKILGAQTLRWRTARTGKTYGESWSIEECRIADLIAMAYQNKHTSTIAIIKFVLETTNESLESFVVQQVKNKIDRTNEKLLQYDAVYLSDAEYAWLMQNKKPGRRY